MDDISEIIINFVLAKYATNLITNNMKHSIIAICTAALLVGCTAKNASDMPNPFLSAYDTPYEIPPFEKIDCSHYLPALEAGIAQKQAQIDSIIANPEEATFDNTIMPLENSGEILDKVALVYFALAESDSSDDMVKVGAEFYPKFTQFNDEITMNAALFERVKHVYDNREGLAADKKLLVENYYKMFANNGALLDDAKKAELKAINTELAALFLQFNNNLLSATNAFAIVIDDEARLSGLSESSIAQAADEAKARGMEGKWVFTLHGPSRLPLLQFADDRDLREQMYKGYTTLATEGEFNNEPVINKILQARTKKAELLGFKNFGSYMTNKVMAKTVENAENLLLQIWKPAVKRVHQEVAEMQALANTEGKNIKIEPWDYYYYAEKVRKQKYALDENEVRQYFAADSVVNGIFIMAERLYGIKFAEMPDAPKYNPEVTVYDVTDAATNEHVAVFMTDYFPRASKRQGAWMSEFKRAWQYEGGKSARPVVYNVGNFAPPSGDTPALLTIDDVETVFHEFGHGLHGMLTRAELKSQAGTSVDRDFVELPSQIHEHWAFAPEMLKLYAHHWKTGEVIPDELIAKLQAASTHNQGFATVELAGAALLDLEFGKLNVTEDIDIQGFAGEVADKLDMPDEVTYRYRPTYFKHIFGSDEYSSGYYTYLWAEVLDADGFKLFEEKGIFDPETAKSFKTNILEAGGSADPMELFVKFRGHEPSVEALLKNRGL